MLGPWEEERGWQAGLDRGTGGRAREEVRSGVGASSGLSEQEKGTVVSAMRGCRGSGRARGDDTGWGGRETGVAGTGADALLELLQD